jgi:dTDP-4-dehydrorhamnose 3,5-epimerase
LRDHGIDFTPVQANVVYSARAGTVRGMHYQVEPHFEAKLVRCTRGAMFDVVVDLRRDSPSFRRWHGVDLSADNGRMLFIPPGCAHACQALEDGSELYYLTSARYAPDFARGVRHDDPAIGVEWPLPIAHLSPQDRSWSLLSL